MTDRERWIVYPLLFLALGTSLRDKLTQTVQADVIDCKTITADLIRCKQILVGDEPGKPKIVLGLNDAGGLVTVIDQTSNLTLALGHFGRISGVLASNAEGKLIHWVPSFVRPATTDEPTDEDKD